MQMGRCACVRLLAALQAPERLSARRLARCSTVLKCGEAVRLGPLSAYVNKLYLYFLTGRQLIRLP
jgi:hypothetical protein